MSDTKQSAQTTAESAVPSQVRIAAVKELADFERCVEVQLAVWGYSDGDLIPKRVFIVADRIGGQVIGAFDRDAMVGFAMALPGYRAGKPYLHSHMLAVLPEYRNAGLGRRLKLAQRDDALARGFDLMEWTFDPLEIKNAYLNIEKLGAIARRYHVNQYGITSSPLQGGLPTDRLVAEWWMKSKRVEAVLAGAPPATFECRARIEVPAEIYEWKADPAKSAQALAIQKRNRAQFAQAFTEGLSVLGYERNESNERGDGRFLLGKWDEHLGYR
jgi:predicted GNAT superfamily acetyltransferase